MDDPAVKLSLQDAAAELARRFPERGFALFVFPAEAGQLAHYTSNVPREGILRAMRELADTGLPGLPGDVSRS